MSTTRPYSSSSAVRTRACHFLAASASRCRRSRSPSRRRASSHMRSCSRGAAAAMSCCSSSATVVRARLLFQPRAAGGAICPRGGAPAHACGLAVGAPRRRRAAARPRRGGRFSARRDLHTGEGTSQKAPTTLGRRRGGGARWEESAALAPLVNFCAMRVSGERKWPREEKIRQRGRLVISYGSSIKSDKIVHVVSRGKCTHFISVS